MTAIDNMTEEEYEYLVNIVVEYREHYIGMMTKDHIPPFRDRLIKHRTWLHLLGLIETWNIVE